MVIMHPLHTEFDTRTGRSTTPSCFSIMPHKKLVFEYSTQSGSKHTVPEEYLLAKHFWIADIIGETQDGLVEEHECYSKTPMLITDFLADIYNLIAELLGEEVTDAGFKIYLDLMPGSTQD